MKPNDDPANHRKARFRGNSAGRQACLKAQVEMGEPLAETFATGVIEGVMDFLAAAFGEQRAADVARAIYDRAYEPKRQAAGES